MVFFGMPASSTIYPHLRLDESGRAWVDGVNVKVSEIAADYMAHGSSVEEIAIQFPHLSPSMIHAALTYFYDHREEFDATMGTSLDEARAKAKAAAAAGSPLRERLGKSAGKA